MPLACLHATARSFLRKRGQQAWICPTITKTPTSTSSLFHYLFNLNHFWGLHSSQLFWSQDATSWICCCLCGNLILMTRCQKDAFQFFAVTVKLTCLTVALFFIVQTSTWFWFSHPTLRKKQDHCFLKRKIFAKRNSILSHEVGEASKKHLYSNWIRAISVQRTWEWVPVQSEKQNRTSDVDIPAPEERRKKAHMAEPNRLSSSSRSSRPISPSPQNHQHCRPNLRLEAWKAKQCDCISWVHPI